MAKTAAYEKVFGGYTSKSWSQVEDYVSDSDAFVFSVTKQHKAYHHQRRLRYLLYGQAGPVFGAGYDIFICSNSDIVEDSSTTLGMTYKGNDNMGDLTAYLGGGSSFMLQEIEVFKVNMN